MHSDRRVGAFRVKIKYPSGMHMIDINASIKEHVSIPVLTELGVVADQSAEITFVPMDSEIQIVELGYATLK